LALISPFHFKRVNFFARFVLVMNAVRNSPSSRSARKLYHSMLSADLNEDRLEHFLCCEMEMYCKDYRLCTLARLSCAGMSQRLRTVGLENSYEDLSNVVVVLVSFLNSSQSLPAGIVYETHSFLGLIKSSQRNYQAARMHVLKALWIVSSSMTEAEIPREQLAIAEHRLGRAYAAGRHYNVAKGLIEKALGCYTETGVACGHPCVVEASQILAECKQAIAATLSTKPKKRLSFIEEESDSDTKNEPELRSD
jgi:hypothetical protein